MWDQLSVYKLRNHKCIVELQLLMLARVCLKEKIFKSVLNDLKFELPLLYICLVHQKKSNHCMVQCFVTNLLQLSWLRIALQLFFSVKVRIVPTSVEAFLMWLLLMYVLKADPRIS